MGYESRLYVIEKTNIKNCCGAAAGMRYGIIIAIFEMGKVPSVSGTFRAYPKTDAFVYESDGNTEIVVDDCGDPLTEIPLDDALRIIEADNSFESYRRHKPLIAFLKAIDTREWRHEICVLHYGH